MKGNRTPATHTGWVLSLAIVLALLLVLMVPGEASLGKVPAVRATFTALTLAGLMLCAIAALAEPLVRGRFEPWLVPVVLALGLLLALISLAVLVVS